MEAINPDLFEPYEKLVTIRIKGKAYQVPENNSVMRGFQFLEADLSMAKFCWNGECENCLFSFTVPEGKTAINSLACRETAVEGMEIRQLPMGIKFKS